MSERGVNAEKDVAGSGNEPLVLVIEDDMGLVRLIRLILSSAGFEVMTATSGDEALRLAAGRRPDIVSVDLRLAGLSGEDTISAFKERFGIPVIVLTGWVDDDEVLLNCLARGAGDIVAKPFPPENLEAAVRFLLGRPEARQASGEAVRVGEFEIDPTLGRIKGDGKVIPLAYTEWRLLEALLSRQGLPVLQKELLSRVWGPHFQGHVKFLQAWMSRLSEKIDAGRATGRLIVDFLGVGYALGPELSEPRRR